MCLVIVTFRVLLWNLVTLISATAIFAAITTPRWLVGPPQILDHQPSLRTTDPTRFPAQERKVFYPSLGIYNRCTRIEGMLGDHCASFVHRARADNAEEYFPSAWQATLVFFGAGLVLLVLTLMSSIIGWFKRSVRRKSIFNITGSIQALSVLLFVLALVVYPAGWSSTRVRRTCGDHADAFSLGDCTFGWAFYVAIGGTLLTCLSALLSRYAETSTSTDKVQDLILEGKRVICLP